MGMSTWVVGIVPADAEFAKKKAAWDACKAAGVEPPEELVAFFGDEAKPDEYGVVVGINFDDWDDGDMSSGAQVDIRKLPPEVKIVRFINSW